MDNKQEFKSWVENKADRQVQFWEAEECEGIGDPNRKIKISKDDYSKLNKNGLRWYAHELKKGRIEIKDD